MPKVTAICYSKDRSAQLDLLIRSVQKNLPNLFDLNIIFKATDQKFAEGYKKLVGYNRGFSNVSFYEETDLRQQTIDIFSCANSDLLGFFVDDNLIYRPHVLTYEQIDDALSEDVCCFSTRLGLNIISDSLHLIVPQKYFHKNGFVYYPRNKQWQNNYFEYPFSLDGSVFRRQYLLSCLKNLEFDFPNPLENNLVMKFGKTAPNYIMSLEQSLTVNSPNNRVQNIFPNWNGRKYSYSSEFLNEQFLAGKRLQVIIPSVIDCPHTELEMEFT